MLEFEIKVCLNLVAGGFTVTPDEVFAFFGDRVKTAKALDVTQQALHEWSKKGRVPESRQYQIELISKGVLKAGTKVA